MSEEALITSTTNDGVNVCAVTLSYYKLVNFEEYIVSIWKVADTVQIIRLLSVRQGRRSTVTSPLLTRQQTTRLMCSQFRYLIIG